MSRIVVAVMLGLAAVGCASTSPKPAFDETAKVVEDRTGHQVMWNQDGEADKAIADAVTAMLSKPLGVGGAVQIALLRNRHLAATFEDLGIAQADLVQAGLLKNPSLGGGVLFPLSGTTANEVSLGGAFDLIDAFMVPARTHVAASRLAATKARVADAVLEVARDVAAAYYAAVGSQQEVTMRKAVMEAGEAAAELTRRLAAAGNTSDLDVANREAEVEQLALDELRAQSAATDAREILTRKMGLWGSSTVFTLPEKLPELPADEALPEHLEALAITLRLDLAAAHEDAQAISHELAMAKNFRVWGLLGPAGGSYLKSFEGPELAGPAGSLELPIFDQKQAVVARLEARLRQSLDREEALAVDVRSEARQSAARLLAQRDLVTRYEQHVVPLRQKVVELTQERYNSMTAGVFQLILAKRAEVDAYGELIDALRDYWVVRSDLERAVGGRVGTPPVR